MQQFSIENKKIAIYSIEPLEKKSNEIFSKNRPVIYLNMYSDTGDEIFSLLKKRAFLSFNFVAISGLNWDSDMCPWECPAISKNDTPCVGGADNYLETLTKKIIPFVEEKIGVPTWRGISGYSLGGLFALYALYKTNFFSRIASISGSLWYPNFLEFCKSEKIVQKPDCVYLSLGDKESQTKNKFLKCVQDNTKKIFEILTAQKIKSEFCLNKGNHFVNATERTVVGIEWLLKEKL